MTEINPALLFAVLTVAAALFLFTNKKGGK